MIGLENASVAFGNRRLFSGVSFTVPVGRSLAVLGPNGRGKTTLLRALLGFQPLAAGTRQAPAVAGYVPQHGASQARLTGIEVVIMGRAARLGLFKQPGAEDRDVAERALADVGATHLAELRYDRMSGGQRQMVLIARALAAADDVLLMMPGGRELHGSVAEMIEPVKLSELYGVAMRWVDVTGPAGETRRAIVPAFSGIEAA